MILGIDGLQPDVGHEVLWVVRDCLSGEILLARSLLSARQNDLAKLLQAVQKGLSVPIQGVVSDGQKSIRNAVRQALPGVAHQLCQFHWLREAAKPLYEADRHAKKELKKRVRGIRALHRQTEGRADDLTPIIQAYCAAVRSALTDDGRPPLAASGLKPQGRLEAVAVSLDEVAARRELPSELERLRTILRQGLQATTELWPDVQLGYRWVHQITHRVNNEDGLSGRQVRRRVAGLLGAMARHRNSAGTLAPAIAHFLKVTRSYWPGLFQAYEIPDLPRTNNDLEQLFGAHRYHERRATGRKAASPALVLRGAVRIMASLATRLRPVAATELRPRSIDNWCTLRKQLEERRQGRVLRSRFRRNPTAYLRQLEDQLLQPSLPA